MTLSHPVLTPLTPLTPLTLTLLTLLDLWSGGAAILRLRQGDPPPDRALPFVGTTLALTGLIALGLLVLRVLVTHDRWQLFESHVDGLLLAMLVISVGLLALWRQERMRPLAAFALPLLGLLAAWGVCASIWTYRPFDPAPPGSLGSHAIGTAEGWWNIIHLIGAYGGLGCSAVAAAAAGLYLTLRRRLRTKRDLGGLDRVPSLERLEALVRHAAALGFVLMTLGVVSGLVELRHGSTPMGSDWWFSPKFLLGMAAWAMYGIVVSGPILTAIRGPRAAWLTILGFVLLMTTLALAVAWPMEGGAS